jgi:hypothetical protein
MNFCLKFEPLLFAVCCLPFVVCRLLFVVGGVYFAYCLLRIAYCVVCRQWSSSVVRRLWSVVILLVPQKNLFPYCVDQFFIFYAIHLPSSFRALNDTEVLIVQSDV